MLRKIKNSLDGIVSQVCKDVKKMTVEKLLGNSTLKTNLIVVDMWSNNRQVAREVEIVEHYIHSKSTNPNEIVMRILNEVP